MHIIQVGSLGQSVVATKQRGLRDCCSQLSDSCCIIIVLKTSFFGLMIYTLAIEETNGEYYSKFNCVVRNIVNEIAQSMVAYNLTIFCFISNIR